MKKTVIVTIEKVIELDIKDECLTDEALDEFEGCIFKLDDKDTRVDSLFAYVAEQVANYEGIGFVEGVGKIVMDYQREELKKLPETMAVCEIQQTDTSSELE